MRESTIELCIISKILFQTVESLKVKVLAAGLTEEDISAYFVYCSGPSILVYCAIFIIKEIKGSVHLGDTGDIGSCDMHNVTLKTE